MDGAPPARGGGDGRGSFTDEAGGWPEPPSAGRQSDRDPFRSGCGSQRRRAGGRAPAPRACPAKPGSECAEPVGLRHRRAALAGVAAWPARPSPPARPPTIREFQAHPRSRTFIGRPGAENRAGHRRCARVQHLPRAAVGTLRWRAPEDTRMCPSERLMTEAGFQV